MSLEGSYDAHTQWRKEGRENVTEIDLKLSLDELVKPENITKELRENGQTTRRKMINLLATNFFPKIVRDSGHSPAHAAPDSGTNARVHSDWDTSIGHDDVGFNLHSDHRVTVRTRANAETTAIEDLYNARNIVAENITDGIMTSVKREYLDNSTPETALDAHLKDDNAEDDNVVEPESRDIDESEDNNGTFSIEEAEARNAAFRERLDGAKERAKRGELTGGDRRLLERIRERKDTAAAPRRQTQDGYDQEEKRAA